MTDDTVPLSGLTHSGVPLYLQGPKATARARSQIDYVLSLNSVHDLAAVIQNRKWAAESRLLAFGLIKGQCEQCADEKRTMPQINLDEQESRVAHISTEWMRIVERGWPPEESAPDPLQR